MIIKRRKTKNFACVPNALFEHPRLSLAAKGLVGYLLSRPPNWEIRHGHLQHALGIGRKVLDRCVLEAISAGYVQRADAQGRDEGNRFTTYAYIVTDEPGVFFSDAVVRKPRAAKPQHKTDNDNKKEESNTNLQTPLSPKAGVHGATGLPKKDEARRVFIDNDTPQRRAWDEYDRAKGRRLRPENVQDRSRAGVHFGWWFPSEWPPKISNNDPNE